MDSPTRSPDRTPVVRSARSDEALQLSSLARASKASRPYGIDQVATWRDDLTITPQSISSTWTRVAEVDGTVAGFFALAPGDRAFTLEHFWVSPIEMGRGVGRALLAHAVALAIDEGASSIAIDADPQAEPFYERLGARRVGTVPAPIAGEPHRARPQLVIDLTHHAMTASGR